ncbi:uracil-DNA glycosylase family protein, partial [candidate division KSB1 bacterium]
DKLWGNFDLGYSSLDEMYNDIKDCRKCGLYSTRTKFVFGKGNPDSKLILIGEAPGRDEDLKGEPFVGRAGQLLTKILKAISLNREDVYIANILKCRPPDNRDPLESEVEMCLPHLNEQIKLIKPKIILCLGRVSANCLLQLKMSMKELRGKIYDYRGIKMLVTYHPAALLRNPNLKRPTWEDVQFVRKLYDEE